MSKVWVALWGITVVVEQHKMSFIRLLWVDEFSEEREDDYSWLPAVTQYFVLKITNKAWSLKSWKGCWHRPCVVATCYLVVVLFEFYASRLCAADSDVHERGLRILTIKTSMPTPTMKILSADCKVWMLKLIFMLKYTTSWQKYL